MEFSVYADDAFTNEGHTGCGNGVPVSSESFIRVKLKVVDSAGVGLWNSNLRILVNNPRGGDMKNTTSALSESLSWDSLNSSVAGALAKRPGNKKTKVDKLEYVDTDGDRVEMFEGCFDPAELAEIHNEKGRITLWVASTAPTSKKQQPPPRRALGVRDANVDSVAALKAKLLAGAGGVPMPGMPGVMMGKPPSKKKRPSVPKQQKQGVSTTLQHHTASRPVIPAGRRRAASRQVMKTIAAGSTTEDSKPGEGGKGKPCTRLSAKPIGKWNSLSTPVWADQAAKREEQIRKAKEKSAARRERFLEKQRSKPATAAPRTTTTTVRRKSPTSKGGRRRRRSSGRTRVMDVRRSTAKDTKSEDSFRRASLGSMVFRRVLKAEQREPPFTVKHTATAERSPPSKRPREEVLPSDEDVLPKSKRLRDLQPRPADGDTLLNIFEFETHEGLAFNDNAFMAAAHAIAAADARQPVSPELASMLESVVERQLRSVSDMMQLTSSPEVVFVKNGEEEALSHDDDQAVVAGGDLNWGRRSMEELQHRSDEAPEGSPLPTTGGDSITTSFSPVALPPLNELSDDEDEDEDEDDEDEGCDQTEACTQPPPLRACDKKELPGYMRRQARRQRRQSTHYVPANSWLQTLRSSRALPERDLLRAQCEEQAGVTSTKRKTVYVPGMYAQGRAGGRGGGGGGGGGGTFIPNFGGSKEGGGSEEMAALSAQIEILKQVTGLNDEDLKWKMDCMRPGSNAYRLAKAGVQRAEAAFDRFCYQAQELRRASAAERPDGVVDCVSEAAALASSCLNGGAAVEQATDIIARLRQLQELLTREAPTYDDGSGRSFRLLEGPEAEASTVARDSLRRVLKAAAALSVALNGNAKQQKDTPELAQALTRSINEANESMKEVSTRLASNGVEIDNKSSHAADRIEVWHARVMDAPERAVEEAAEEREWAEENASANEAALRETRSFVPLTVARMTAQHIVDAAAGNSGFMTCDLALRIKENRMLHWVVMHLDDVRSSNFLQGDGVASFTQLQSYDLTELRAVYCCLPGPDSAFEHDGDGKKAEWRRNFVAHLKNLVAQEQGHKVLHGWDPVRKCRKMVQLQPLRQDLRRNSLYTVPSVDSVRARIDKLSKQAMQTEKKRQRVAALTDEISTAKADFDAACADARSSDLKAKFGKDTLKRVRDDAKSHHQALVRERRRLVTEIAGADSSAATAFPSKENLAAELAHVAAAATDAVAMTGAFDEAPELKKRERSTFRKLSAEEEAAERVAELRAAIGGGNSGNSEAGGEDGGVELVEEPTVQAVEELSSTAPCAAPDPAPVAAPASALGSAPAPAPGKVRVAPAVAAFLNKEFSGHAATTAPLFRKAAIAAPTETKQPEPEQQQKTQAKAVMPRSKALCALAQRMEAEDEGAPAGTQQPPPAAAAAAVGLSFLDQIKARNTANKPATGFLDELKAKRQVLN